jgi:hypothetical protein
MSNTTDNAHISDLSEVLRRQSGPGDFLCAHCRNYEGKLICDYGYFIAWIGADTSGCGHYEIERRKKC